MLALYGSDGSVRSRGFLDVMPPRLFPALPLSRAARTGSRDHDREIHLRPARPRRQAPSHEVRDDVASGLVLTIQPTGVWSDPLRAVQIC